MGLIIQYTTRNRILLKFQHKRIFLTLKRTHKKEMQLIKDLISFQISNSFQKQWLIHLHIIAPNIINLLNLFHHKVAMALNSITRL